MNTTTLLFSVVNGLIYYDMLEFNDLKCEAFKKQNTSMQLLHMFQDALRMINQQYADSVSVLALKRRVSYSNCDIDRDSFTIRLRVFELPDLSFPVFWFASQSAVYREICKKSHSRIDVQFCCDCTPKCVEVVYHVWFEDSIPF